MQLEKDQPFSTQISGLSGDDFENIVAACYYYLGYFILRNVDIRVQKQTAAEIDVLASLITPLIEIRYAIECKGQTPSFNDLRKFSTIRQIHFKNNVDLDLLAYGANDIRDEHIEFSKILQVSLIKKNDLSKKVLPIIWGDNEIVNTRIGWLNRYLSIFSIKDYYHRVVYSSIQDPDLKKEINKYKTFLRSYLWSVEDPVEQLELSFDKAKGDFNGFTNKIAGLRGTTVENELSNAQDDIVQLAMLLELEHRILNLFSFARCSFLARTSKGRQVITDRTPTIREELNRLCDHNMSITSFMPFVFRFIYLYGGIILKRDNLLDIEVKNLAKECGISEYNCKLFLVIVMRIYSQGNNLFFNNNQKRFMKYVPAAFRALGKIHRNTTYPDDYSKKNLFHEDQANLNALDRAISDIGGHGYLKY